MGSAEIVQWISEGYLAGDPLRSALFVGAAFLSMPFQLLAMLS